MVTNELQPDVDGRLAEPDVREMLNRMRGSNTPQYSEIPLVEARALVEASVSLQDRPPAMASIRDIVMERHDYKIPIRLYMPEQCESTNLIVFVHGGGWVTGSIASADPLCRSLAHTFGSPVASIEYRKSPEFPFPAAYDDVTSTLDYLASLRRDLGLNTNRLIAVGESAGANLIASSIPKLRHLITDQILFYPPLLAPRDLGKGSYELNAQDPVLSAKSMRWFWDQYVPSPEDRTNATVSPLLSPDLREHPRTLLFTCGLDVLRDEGLQYATKLSHSGTDVTLIHYPGVTHGFLSMSKFISAAARSLRLAADWVRGSPPK